MLIADRIQALRKTKGISQEQLADEIGVSRQAVSKWESEQALPDLDKVILLGDYFGVSTDYLLKGIEPAAPNSSTVDPKTFALLGTVFNLLGLILAAALWRQWQTPLATAAGAMLMICGGALCAAGCMRAQASERANFLRRFWMFNLWPVVLLGLSVAYNSVLFRMPAPYPLWHWHVNYTALFGLFYFAACLVATLLLAKHPKRSRP